MLREAAPYLRAPILFSIMTGLRLSNVINLDWSEADSLSKMVTVTVKGGKKHSLPLNSGALSILYEIGPQADGRVFLRDGRPIRSWRTAWEGALRRAGIKDFRWHDLRHTAASRLVQSGVDLSIVQEVLGHSKIETTQRYAHFKPDAVAQALEKLSLVGVAS